MVAPWQLVWIVSLVWVWMGIGVDNDDNNRRPGVYGGGDKGQAEYDTNNNTIEGYNHILPAVSPVILWAQASWWHRSDGIPASVILNTAIQC